MEILINDLTHKKGNMASFSVGVQPKCSIDFTKCKLLCRTVFSFQILKDSDFSPWHSEVTKTLKND